jgi:hypothetical protein
MERMWQQVAEDARKEGDAALQAAASRQQELSAVRDELRHAQDRITQLTALEANWRHRTEAAQQQVRMCFDLDLMFGAVLRCCALAPRRGSVWITSSSHVPYFVLPAIFYQPLGSDEL